MALGIISCSACTGIFSRSEPKKPEPPAAFYTVTGEIALSRHEVRVAALQYSAAAAKTRDLGLLRRAAEVTAACLQPTLTAAVANRWIEVEPAATDAHRAAAMAALELHRIEQSAAQYRSILKSSPSGTPAEFAALESQFASTANTYGARQVADRLAQDFPAYLPALRVQAFAALRADDPAAAVRTFQAALAAGDGTPEGGGAAPDPAMSANASSADSPASPPSPADMRRELTQGLWRARILAGDAEEPLALAKGLVEAGPTAENRLNYALLLLAAQRTDDSRAQLAVLAEDPQAKAVAVRLMGLIDFQQGKLDDAGARFAELVTTGKFLDDALYYLGVIAERHQDLERALRLYSQVQAGDNVVAALLRAATILRSHGAAPAAEQLLDQLVDDEPQRAPEILVARARIYSDAGDTPEAFAVLEQAEQEYPDSVEVRYAIASTVEEQGKVDDALQILRRNAALRPADPAALNAYGYTLADHNRQLDRARKLIEQAYAAAPKSAAIQDSLGWVLFRQGHGDQALPYLDAAYRDEHDGDIAAHLGEVLWRLGRRADAERVWSEAGRADSDNHLLKATQLRLHASN